MRLQTKWKADGRSVAEPRHLQAPTEPKFRGCDPLNISKVCQMTKTLQKVRRRHCDGRAHYRFLLSRAQIQLPTAMTYTSHAICPLCVVPPSTGSSASSAFVSDLLTDTPHLSRWVCEWSWMGRSMFGGGGGGSVVSLPFHCTSPTAH